MARTHDELLAAVYKARGNDVFDMLREARSPANEGFWTCDSQLYRAFAQVLTGQGHPTKAYEIATEGLVKFPNDAWLRYRVALALRRGGNVTMAGRFLWPLLDPASEPMRALPDTERQKLAVEAMSLRGALYKIAFESRDPTHRTENAAESARWYGRAKELPGADYFPTVNAATMNLLAGDEAAAKACAERAIEQASPLHKTAKEKGNYWVAASLGEANLVKSYFDGGASMAAARGFYQEAVGLALDRGSLGDVASMRQNAVLLKGKLRLTAEFLREFVVGDVVVFAGHMIDHPDRQRQGLAPRFPPHRGLIDAVRQAIAASLAEMKPAVGICSVACGADILFAEEFLTHAKKGALHVVLPFALEDFYKQSVDFAENLSGDTTWRQRCEKVLKSAVEIHYATPERSLNDTTLLEFCIRYTTGLALVWGARLGGITPSLLALRDATAQKRRAGTTEFAEQWQSRGLPCRQIDLKPLRERAVGSAGVSEPGAVPRSRVSFVQRELKAVLFADLHGFSKLDDEVLPRFFVGFLREVSDVLKSLAEPPAVRNTWGDGLYLVFDSVRACAEAAVRLSECCDQLDFCDLGFETPESPIRIGAHVGPVFRGWDAVIGRDSFFGSQVTRAARIEPVTLPGCVYVSEQFAAILQTEGAGAYACDFIGNEPLAKDYDNHCPLYRLSRRRTE